MKSESRTASAIEDLVRRDAFAEILARVTENLMAVTRIRNDVLDLFVRNLRVASRQDVVRLARRLACSEDTLELVLQAVERLEEQLDAGQGAREPSGGGSSRSGRTGAGSSSSSSDGSRSKGGERGGRPSRATSP